MTRPWIALLPCALITTVLALSCGSSNSGGTGGSSGTGAAAGLGGSPGAGGGGRTEVGGNSGSNGNAGASAGGEAGAQQIGGAGGSVAAAGSSEGGGAGAESAGAGGSAGAPEDTSPLSPSAIPDLAFWLDGNSQTFSDKDANYPNPPDSGWVRTVPETPPLTGTWQALTPYERPIRELGAFNLRPVDVPPSITGYNLYNQTANIQTDNSTLAFSFCPLNSNSAQGGISAPVPALVGTGTQPLGVFFNGDSVGVYFNHTQVVLKQKLSRGLHVSMIVRFSPTGVDVDYEFNGFRTSESIVATIAHETATGFSVGFDAKNSADMYGFVSQVVGINRAVSDFETGRLMTWLDAQPIPTAFPVTKPLVAIVGDSIANGDQIPQVYSWGFMMLGDLSNTYPDVQLLNTSENGSGIPTVKNSDYSDFVLPWYSASRAKNIFIVAAGTNDLASGGNLQDTIDRYYGLLDSARATGWKTVACTVLPRSDPTIAAGVTGFETARTAFNTDVVAHWASHADALADVAAIPGMGAAGDSNNTTYYVDKVHPTQAGHALLEPVYRAAVAGEL